jgi:hypothetical protein
MNFSHHPTLALKGVLLFPAHYFAFGTKASLLTGYPSICKLASTSGFHRSLRPQKDFLF